MKRRTVAALSLLISTAVVGGIGESDRPLDPSERFVHKFDPCVLTEVPESKCRRWKLIRFSDGYTYRIRITLTAQQRAEAERWWARPENRWRRR